MFIGSILNSSVLAKSLCVKQSSSLFSISKGKASSCFFALAKEETKKILNNSHDRIGEGKFTDENLEKESRVKKPIIQNSLELLEEQEIHRQSYLYDILNNKIDGVNNRSKEVTTSSTSKGPLNSCINIDLVNIDIGKYDLLGKKNISVASTSRRINSFNNSSTGNGYGNNQGNVSSSGGGGNGIKRRVKRG